MLIRKQRGRPATGKAKKPGDLNEDECRFTFIAKREQISELKKDATEREITIKELMIEVINSYLDPTDFYDSAQLKLETRYHNLKK